MGPSADLILLIFAILAPLTSSIPAFFPGAAYQSLANQHKAAKPKIPYKAHYFPQILDHFTFQPSSSKVFYQKYLINNRYWKKGGPIFVYTGNEGDIEWFAANTGFLLDIAPKFRALLVFIEHRFYGESMPFGKDSYKSTETLGYLNSQQALADYAVLIRNLKQNLSSETSPVVVFGGSYGGMLAAWFRLKYPHIAIGALASSAPILQFDGITPWTSFYDAVSQDFKEASLNCFGVIKGSWEELLALATQKEGLTELSRTFRTCKDLHSLDAVLDWLWSAFVYTAMVNYPFEASFMMPLPANPVAQMCKIIDEFPPGASKVSRVFAAASLYYNYSRSNKCFQLEHGPDAHGLHGWDWQVCTEMVMPMSCSERSMFPPTSYNYKELAERCMKRYGVVPRPHWITTEFGGKRIDQVLKRSGGNIIFSNGMQDPWSRGSELQVQDTKLSIVNISENITNLVPEHLSILELYNLPSLKKFHPPQILCLHDCVLKNISSSIIAIVTQKGAHHVDFRAATKDDPDWLIEQRRQEVEIIHKWINQYYADLKRRSKDAES